MQKYPVVVPGGIMMVIRSVEKLGDDFYLKFFLQKQYLGWVEVCGSSEMGEGIEKLILV